MLLANSSDGDVVDGRKRDRRDSVRVGSSSDGGSGFGLEEDGSGRGGLLNDGKSSVEGRRDGWNVDLRSRSGT